MNFHVVRQRNMSILAFKYEECTCLKVQIRHYLCDSLFAALLSINTRLQQYHSDGLVQERRNSSALAMELRLSCTNPSIQLFLTAEEYVLPS